MIFCYLCRVHLQLNLLGMQTLQQGHMLKFVAKGKNFNPHIGVRTFPRQTYGVSEDSPEQFKQKHTLVGQNSYIYQHEGKPEFEYHSQQHFFNVHTSTHLGDSSQLPSNHAKNQIAFHRKKGRLTQFMDKNGWMSKVTPIMGYERGSIARSLCNRDRQKRINSLAPCIKYENPVAQKCKVDSTDYNKTITVLMGEKLRIKKNRQELNQLQGPATARVIEREPDPFLAGNVEDKVIKTNMDFYSTNTTFHQRGATAQTPKRDLFRFSRLNKRAEIIQKGSRKFRESASPCAKNLSSAQENTLRYRGQSYREPQSFENENLQLEDWFRNTCHNKWSYRPKKLDTEQRQEERQKLMVSTNF